MFKKPQDSNFVAFGHRGSTLKIKKHPRKELLEYFGRKHADKVYLDSKDGGAEHVGYVVAGEWFQVYKLTPAFEQKAKPATVQGNLF